MSNLRKTVLAASLGILMAPAFAGVDSNIIRQTAPIFQSPGTWGAIAAQSAGWIRASTPLSCDAWSPDASALSSSQTVTQTSACHYQETRTTQAREQNSVTGVIRNSGDPQVEQRIADVTRTQTVQGPWQPTSDYTSSWVRKQPAQSCTAWTPSEANYEPSVSVAQSQQCQYQETRTIQAQEQNVTTAEIRNKGDAKTESRTVTDTSNRTVQGTGVTETYVVTVGQYNRGSFNYWGYMDPPMLKLWGITQASASSIDHFDYKKQYQLKAAYYANDNSNVFVLAYSVEAPNTPPAAITVNGKTCSIRNTYYENQGYDVFHTVNCGSELMNKAGTTFKLTLR